MITLALFEEMSRQKVAGLIGDPDDPKRNFYWEEAPLQHNGDPAQGVWLITRGGNISNSRRGLNLKTTVDFYVGLRDAVEGEKIHREILRWLTKTLGFCELRGSVRGMDYHFSNIRLRPEATPQNDGVTDNGVFVKVASCLLVYDDEKIN